MSPEPIAQGAEDLRRSFDESFSIAYRLTVEPHEDFLGIRVGQDPFAIRLAEISGLFNNKSVTAVPLSTAEFLGVANFRGTIVPVFDLRSLLGHPRGTSTHWLILARAPELVSFAFDQFENQYRLLRPLGPVDDSEERTPGLHRIITVGGTSRPVLHLPSILEDLRNRANGAPKRSSN